MQKVYLDPLQLTRRLDDQVHRRQQEWEKNDYEEPDAAFGAFVPCAVHEAASRLSHEKELTLHSQEGMSSERHD